MSKKIKKNLESDKKVKVKKYSENTKSDEKNDLKINNTFEVPTGIVIGDDTFDNTHTKKPEKQPTKNKEVVKNIVCKIDDGGIDMVKLQEQYDRIMFSSDEWHPDMYDDNIWEIINDDKDKPTGYYRCVEIPKIEIAITKEFIDDIEKCKNIKKILGDRFVENTKHIIKMNDDNATQIIKFAKFFDGANSYISYCAIPVECSIKKRLLLKEKDDKSELMKIFTNFENVKYEILGCYKYKGKVDHRMLTKFKNTFKDGIDTLVDVNNIVFWDKYVQRLITDEIKNEIIAKSYYIYQIVKKTDAQQQYIFGSFDQHTKKDINNVIYKYDVLFDEGLLEIKKIEEIRCCLEIEGLVKVDENIIKNDSIKNGLNKCYNIFRDSFVSPKIVKNYIFLNVQRCVVKEMYFDVNDYEKMAGYVAVIENDKGICYVFGENNNVSIKNKLLSFYDHINFNEDMRIMKVLLDTPFNKLKITILERNVIDLVHRVSVYSSAYENSNVISKNNEFKNVKCKNNDFLSKPKYIQDLIMRRKFENTKKNKIAVNI